MPTDAPTDRRAAIIAQTKTAIAKARADMRATALPIWRAMHKRHFAEQRLFQTREQRVTGKIKNAIGAIKSMGAVRGDNSAQGFLGNAFNFLTSTAKREMALTQRQEIEKRTYATAQRREIKVKAAAIRTEHQGQVRDNVKQLDQERKALTTSQDQERQSLRSEWRDRNQERGESWSKVRASSDLRRQVAERFSSKERNNEIAR